jgi:methylglutamate dehydrogenase subunit D
MADRLHQTRSPLDGHAAPGRFGRQNGAPGVQITVVRDATAARLCSHRGQVEQLASAAREALGLALPDSPRWVAGRAVRALWDGPERWLLLFDEAPTGGVETSLGRLQLPTAQPARAPTDSVETFLGRHLGRHATVVDQSHAHFRLRIAGSRVRDVLAKGIAIDLHERAFQPGAVALTVVAHINVTLAQLDAAPSYEILGPRSSAASFWHWLEASAGEFGFTVDIA